MYNYFVVYALHTPADTYREATFKSCRIDVLASGCPQILQTER